MSKNGDRVFTDFDSEKLTLANESVICFKQDEKTVCMTISLLKKELSELARLREENDRLKYLVDEASLIIEDYVDSVVCLDWDSCRAWIHKKEGA